ncbi:hypothetical protein [Novosphingobium sp. 9U]|uniref:hypothetical protein n=1 Tax=Novosphingobium sp. 9U TaxID=2653158 RepID=UPI0012EF3B51|nr:Enoyl-CoA hydratase (valine degradation) [Novosphingobium sp. 9U]
MEAHRIDSRLVYARGRTSDAVEGVNSFLEKRPPDFSTDLAKGFPDFFPWWDEPEWH